MTSCVLRLWVPVVIAALTPLGAAAQSPAREYGIPDSVVVDLPLASNGIAYQLYVHTPPECREDGRRCKAVYMLDAEYSFALSSTIVAHLAARGRIEPLISVAIGYPDKSEYQRDRTRDYTPYHYPSGGYAEGLQRASGGGPAFLEVLQTLVFPYVEHRFRASPASRTLAGHSYGGLFATYALITKPELFENYIIVSPSLWYAERRPLADLRTFCAAPAEGDERDVFIAVGEYEEQPENGRAMVSDVVEMRDVLAGCARPVAVEARVFEDETHASIFPAALSTGLRKHFQ